MQIRRKRTLNWCVALACSSIATCAPLPRESARPTAGARPTAAPPGERARARPLRDLVGLNVKFAQGEPLSDLPMLDELGVSWVRDGVDWATLEPEAGKFVDLPREFLERAAFYRAHDIGVVFLLAYHNWAAYPATAREPLRAVDPVAFGRYAAVVAQRLRALGLRFVLEIWNEPHNFVIGPLLSGSWNGSPPAPWLEHYLKMLREAVRQVKSQDPTAKLLSDDDMWIIHYWFLEAGLPSELDGFAFHPYTRAWPERAAVEQSTDWLRPFTVVDADASFQSAVRRLRERGRQKLGKEPEMWATEWGFRLGEDSAQGNQTEELVADFLPRAYVSAAAASLSALCWFSARDSVDGPFGLLANDGHRRKPFYALATLSHELGAAELVRQVWGARHPTHGVQAFWFDSPHVHRLIAWNADGTSLRLPLRQWLSRATVKNVFGDRLEPQRDAKGELSVMLSGSPLYFSLPKAIVPVFTPDSERAAFGEER